MEQCRVYFVQADQVGLVKIGYASDLWRRIFDLCMASPVPLVLLAHTPGGHTEEQKLHRRLELDRHHGEWFRPTRAVMACVAEASALDQGVPRSWRPLTGRRLAAVRYAKGRWNLSDEAAQGIVRRHQGIGNAIAGGRLRAADGLIARAAAQWQEDPAGHMSLDEFNRMLWRYGTGGPR